MDRKKTTVVATIAIILVLCLGTFSFVNLNKKELSDNINQQRSQDDDSYDSDNDYGYEKSKKKKSNNDDDLADSSIDTEDTINALEESTNDISEKVIVTSSNTYKTTSSGNVTISSIPTQGGNSQVGNNSNGTTSSAGNNNNTGNHNGGNTGNSSGNTNISNNPGGSTGTGSNQSGNNGDGTTSSTGNNNNGGNNNGGNTGDNSGNTDNSNNPGGSTGTENNPGGNNSGDNTGNNSGNTDDSNNPGGSTGTENNPGGDNTGDNTGNNSGNTDDSNNPGGSTGNENNPGGNNNGDNTGNNSGNTDPNNPGGSTGNENTPGGNNGEDGDNKDDTPKPSDIDIANLVNTLKIMVEQASSRADILAAIEYRNQNKIVEETTKSGNNELISTMNDINKILNDTVPPMITGTSNGAIEKGLVLLLLTDSENDIKKITVNGSDTSVEKILEFKKNGVYTVVVYDDAYNKTEVTFTIKLDESELKIVNLKKSEDYYTNQDVKVTITLSKEIEAVEGWKFTDSTHTAIYKIFKENESGTVIVTSLDSQILEIPYEIDIIDKVVPTLLPDGGQTKTYNSDGSVTMTIRFSKPVYTPRIKENGKYVNISGWKMSGSDATIFTKTFYENKTETIYFEDTYGNIGTADIEVTGVTYNGN